MHILSLPCPGNPSTVQLAVWSVPISSSSNSTDLPQDVPSPQTLAVSFAGMRRSAALVFFFVFTCLACFGSFESVGIESDLRLLLFPFWWILSWMSCSSRPLSSENWHSLWFVEITYLVCIFLHFRGDLTWDSSACDWLEYSWFSALSTWSDCCCLSLLVMWDFLDCFLDSFWLFVVQRLSLMELPFAFWWYVQVLITRPFIECKGQAEVIRPLATVPEISPLYSLCRNLPTSVTPGGNWVD